MKTIIANSPEHALEIFPTWNDRWPNFTPQEVACKHCGAILVDVATLDALQAMRNDVGPLHLTSFYRCKVHNKAVGGAKKSQHLKGRAVDIQVRDYDPLKLIAAGKRAGFGTYATYPKQGFIHFDTRKTPVANWNPPFPPKIDRTRPKSKRKGRAYA